MTITEALAEVNLLKKKITTKEEYSRKMVAFKNHQEDPFKNEGGSRVVLAKERQALSDLRKRLIGIRSAISKANIDNEIEVGGIKRSIFDWLTWKREVYEGELSFARELSKILDNCDYSEKQRPEVYTDDKDAKHVVSYVRNLDRGELQSFIELTEEIYGKLDGQLSLKNATISLTIN